MLNFWLFRDNKHKNTLQQNPQDIAKGKSTALKDFTMK